MISDSASSIVKSSVSSANILAHDIISSAPHFPPSETLYNICRSNHRNNDVDSQLDLLSEGIIDAGEDLLNVENRVEKDLSTAVEHNISQYWSDLENRWQILAKNDMESHPWLVCQAETDLENAYQFSLSKQSLDCDLMEKGISLLSQGKLYSAICHFESELLFRPENSLAWLYLGKNI